MQVATLDHIRGLAEDIASARRRAAAAQAELAAACVSYADARAEADRLNAVGGGGQGRPGRSRPGEFVADEVSLRLREQPFTVRRLIARTRRLAVDLPTVWQAFRAGEVDAEQVRVIDRVARRVTEAHTLAAIDDLVVEAAQTRCPKQLCCWLMRLVVRLEPLAFEARHRRALAERRVTVVQGPDGMGYVTGEVSAADADAIDAMLAAAARSLGADDPRSEQQRRSDLFADLLLGRLGLVEPAKSDPLGLDWLEIEDIDPDTGELLGTRWQRLDEEGAAAGEPIADRPTAASSLGPARLAPRKRSPLRIGIVVPLDSLLGVSECPGELTDRSGLVAAETLRQLIADALGGSQDDQRDELLFRRYQVVCVNAS
jgi:hypothetical protein